jgi:hypothetical protein
MYHIRPHRIFTLIQTPPPERIVSVQLPARRGAGGVTLLETFVMIATLRAVRARRVFEFGTFRGSTTLNLALNVPEEAEVLTLDLGRYEADRLIQHPADVELTRAHLACQNKLDFLGSPVCGKITVLSGDSTKFDFSLWKDSVDFVFIDGGHDLATAQSDTSSALDMVRKDGPSCIFWHDYRNQDYNELTGYLDQLSHRFDIFHIEDTILCAWFSEPAHWIRSHLLSGE